jgi:hypothetical protein
MNDEGSRRVAMVVPPKSWGRRLFLLYRPARPRAWIPRLLFYLLTFFFVPLFSVAALGAFAGGETLAGVPAVVVTVIGSVALRRAAIFADGRLRPSAPADRSGPLDGLTFSLREPPPRRPIRGLLTSGAGWLLMLPGTYGLWRIADRGMRLRERGRRLRAVDGRAVLRKRPHDPPVLVLRSFEEEEMREARPLSPFMRRYEESLSRTLGKFGPVITIGRPGDELGFLGAGRLYVSDSEWQQAVRHFMRSAGAVVIIVGQTEGLWWEISEVFKIVAPERLLFIFPYTYLPDRSGARSDMRAGWTPSKQLRESMDRERRARYEKFRQRVKGLIAEELPRELDKAICLDFGRDGRVRLLQPRYPSRVQYFFGPFAGTHVLADLMYRRYRFDMSRTVWPFVEKLYETVA